MYDNGSFSPTLFHVLCTSCHRKSQTVIWWCLSIIILENQHSVTCCCFLCVFPRSELVEKNTMLRTKAMREKEEQRERRKYNYTLLRIRLPDGSLLQGKSNSSETKWANNLTKMSVESPDTNRRLSVKMICDSRDLLCVGPSACAVCVCTGVPGGRLAALWAHRSWKSETTRVWRSCSCRG